MAPTKTLVQHTNPQTVLDLAQGWKDAFAKLETQADTYRGYINNPGGSSWDGKTAGAAKDRARDDVKAVGEARDSVDAGAQTVVNSVSSSLWPPLKNAQQIISNAEQIDGVTVNEDLSITYNAPDGTSSANADKTKKAVEAAAAELKSEADKWWAAEQMVAKQITDLEQTITKEVNILPIAFNNVDDAFALAPGEAITLEPGETHNSGPFAGTGSNPGIPGIKAADLGEIVKLPDGRLVAVFGDAFTDHVPRPGEALGPNNQHYPSVAVEAHIDPKTGQITPGKVLSGPDGSGHELFPIPDSVKSAHPEATFTLPAGTVTANGKTYMKVPPPTDICNPPAARG